MAGLQAQPLPLEVNPFFDETRLPTLSIDLHPDTLALILAPGNEQSDREYRARFTFDDGIMQQTLEHVGFRLRGNTSRVSAKKSFKVSFNTFVPGRKLFGLEKLNLNGEHNDPSILRAKLAWDLMGTMGVPAARAAHARLFLNGQYYGLYLNVEQVDEQFLQARFGNDTGYLYKCLWPADLTWKGSAAAAYRPTDASRRPYDLQRGGSDSAGYEDLAHLIDVVNTTPSDTFPEAIEAVFDVNGFLRVLAVDVLTGNWDNYWFLKNNFYLYFNPDTGLFHWLPFDLDNTFGVWWDGILPGIDWADRNVYAWGHPSELRPLVRNVLNVPAFRDRFTFYLRQTLAQAFVPAFLLPRIDTLHAALTAAAEADLYRTLDYGFTVADFHASFEQALGGHVTWGLKPYIEARYTTALAQLEATNVPPIVSDIHTLPAQLHGDRPFTVRVRVEDEATPTVTLSYDLAGTTTQVTMADDGQHGDGAAGDRVYGAPVPAPGTAPEVQFHINATDSQAQTSTSALYTRAVNHALGPVVINEFMASNTTALADEQGEFDDWIELHNHGPEAVSLAGMFLTDDLTVPNRWALPAVTLPPGDYLLVWADGTPEQGFLHASFRLERNGEQLGLFDAALAPLDTLTFGLQETDTAYGRTPDGTGPFALLSIPTPGFSNDHSTPVDAMPAVRPAALTAYPHPFGTQLTLTTALATPGPVSLVVYDLLGRPVRHLAAGLTTPGSHTWTWDGHDAAGMPLAPGLYLVRLTTPTFTTTLPVLKITHQ
jgi:hypothetical protein